MSGGVGGVPPAGRVDAIVAALLVVIGATLCMHTFCSGNWGARPNTEDESVYLFQAKTLASGHLTMPAPPHPEFFEAAHLLVSPRFAAKYLPGHAAILAAFEAAGIAWLGPCLLLGLTAATLFVAARLAGLARWAAAIAPLLLLGNTDVFPFFASYLSQSSSVFAAALVIAFAIAAERRPTVPRLAGLCAAIAISGLLRPFAAPGAVATGLAVVLRLRRQVATRTLLLSATPLF